MASLGGEDCSDFSSRDGPNTEEETLIGFCKQMLKSRVFQGYYQERRYVENLKTYRDLIVVDNSEAELKGDLKYIRTRLLNFYRNPNLWIGITPPDMIGAPAGTCMWTDIEGTPFGKYWFQIKSVRFKSNEIYVRVKPLRPVTVTSQAVTDSPNEVLGNSENLTMENLAALLKQWYQAICSTIMTFLQQDITKENLIATLRFIALLTISLVTAAFEAVRFLGIFSLRFFAETRMFLHTATPIIFKIIDLLNKIVYGFYMIVVMIWRDVIGHRNTDNNNQIRMPPYRALPSSMNHRKFIKI